MTSSIRTSSSRSARARLAAGALTLVLAGTGLAACSSGSDSTTSAFCNLDSSLSLSSSLDDIDASDLSGTVTKLEEINDKIKDVKAPEEISSDWATVQKFFADFTAAFDGVDLKDDAALQQAFVDVSGTIQDQVSGMTTAGNNIDEFVQKNCK